MRRLQIASGTQNIRRLVEVGGGMDVPELVYNAWSGSRRSPTRALDSVNIVVLLLLRAPLPPCGSDRPPLTGDITIG